LSLLVLELHTREHILEKLEPPFYSFLLAREAISYLTIKLLNNHVISHVLVICMIIIKFKGNRMDTCSTQKRPYLLPNHSPRHTGFLVADETATSPIQSKASEDSSCNGYAMIPSATCHTACLLVQAPVQVGCFFWLAARWCVHWTPPFLVDLVFHILVRNVSVFS
jgi:hypothetical protein